MGRRWNRLRFKIASYIMGDGWAGVVTRLWLIRDRAMAAVSNDGMVTLAECPALAESLYAPIPGTWALSVTRLDTPQTSCNVAGCNGRCGICRLPELPEFPAPPNPPFRDRGAIASEEARRASPHRFGTAL